MTAVTPWNRLGVRFTHSHYEDRRDRGTPC